MKSIFLEEQKHLEETYDRLELEISKLRKEVELPKSLEVSYLTNTDEIPFLYQEQDRYYSVTLRKRRIIKEYFHVSNEVYFARIDIDFQNYTKSYYISKKGLDFLGTFDWRSDIGSLIYDTTTSKYQEKYEIVLKRRFKLRKKYLIDYKEIRVKDSMDSNVTDEFLIEILNQKKDDEKITDIIKSIQLEQNQIIRLKPSYNMVVIGCAGSGKTMILFHRLSYLSFHEELKWDKVKIISPNNDFKNSFKSLVEDLGLEEVKIITLTDYFKEKLKLFGIKDFNEVIYSEYELKHTTLSKIYSDKVKSDLFGMYKKDLDALYEDLDKLNIISGTSEDLNQVEKYTKLKRSKSNITAATRHNVGFYQNKLAKDKITTIESLKMLLSITLKLSNSSLIHKFTDEIKSFTKNSKDFQLRQAMKVCEELGLKITDKAKLNKLYNSVFYDMDIRKVYEWLKRKSDSIERHHSEINSLTQKKALYNKEVNDLKDGLLRVERDIYHKRQVKSNTRFYYFSSHASLTRQISSLIYEQKEIQAKISKIKEKEANLIEEIQSKLTNFEKYHGKDSSEIGKSHYKTVLDLIVKFLQEYWVIVDYIEMLNKEKLFKKANKKSESILDLRGWFDTKFVDDYVANIIGKENPKIDVKSFHFYYYYLLMFLNTFETFERTKFHSDQLICIDEFQDISEGEIRLLSEVNNYKPTINLFGDFNQRLLSKGLKNLNELSQDFHSYSLSNNYRNTNQVTRYYNKALNKKDIPVGVDGVEVKHISVKQISDYYNKNNKTRLICHTSEIPRFKKLNLPFEVLSVDESKGLEFHTVFVYSKEMNENEKYISFSRSLYTLYLVS